MCSWAYLKTMNKEEKRMKRIAVLFLAFLLFASFAFAGTTTYQVTGPVLEVKDTSITVQKGKEKWEIARDKDTKITGDLKVGSKVTIHYTMKATSVEVKGEEKKKK
jgi:cell division protein YceG involved in septum cleavage